ncbi:MAG: hypothetical protein ABWY55_03640 [Microbacterium sp.]
MARSSVTVLASGTIHVEPAQRTPTEVADLVEIDETAPPVAASRREFPGYPAFPIYPMNAPQKPARERSRTRAWLRSNRATVISLVPIAALVGVLAYGGVVAANDSGVTAAPVAQDAAPALPAPEQDAATWLIDNAETSQRILVDPLVAPSLIDAGWGSDALIAADSSAFGDGSGWRDVALVLSTAQVRAAAAESPAIGAALENSLVLASFGTGAQLVELRRVAPEGAVLAAASQRSAASMRTQFGAELAQNPAIEMSTPDRVRFAGGRVDERISAVIGTIAAEGAVVVAGLPAVPGERGLVFRQIAVTSIGGIPLVQDAQATPQARALFDGLGGAFAPDTLTVDGDDLVVRFPLATPAAID